MQCFSIVNSSKFSQPVEVKIELHMYLYLCFFHPSNYQPLIEFYFKLSAGLGSLVFFSHPGISSSGGISQPGAEIMLRVAVVDGLTDGVQLTICKKMFFEKYNF